MKTSTKIPIKKAAAGTAAKQKEHRGKAYRKGTPMSRNFQDQIGLLLWVLCSSISEKQSEAGWQLFEILLSQSYQVSSQSTH